MTPIFCHIYSERDVRSRPGKFKWIQKNTKIPKSRVIIVVITEKQY